MPHPRKYRVNDEHIIPFEDWVEYIPTEEPTLDQMTLEELIQLSDKLKARLDLINSIIEERAKDSESSKRVRCL